MALEIRWFDVKAVKICTPWWGDQNSIRSICYKVAGTEPDDQPLTSNCAISERRIGSGGRQNKH